jgi:hypothetical protein
MNLQKEGQIYFLDCSSKYIAAHSRRMGAIANDRQGSDFGLPHYAVQGAKK